MCEACKTTEIVRRDYWRCNRCLSVVATNGAKEPKLDCDLCNHPMEWMGQVHQDNLITEEQKSACDDRCTSAQGPVCVCKCSGANHGSGKVVTVIRVLGKVPRVAPIDIYKSKENIRESEEIMKTLDTMKAQIMDDKYKGNRNVYWANRKIDELKYKLKKLKTMASRRKVLETANTQFPILMTQVIGGAR